jgi:hypothetical protein
VDKKSTVNVENSCVSAPVPKCQGLNACVFSRSIVHLKSPNATSNAYTGICLNQMPEEWTVPMKAK